MLRIIWIFNYNFEKLYLSVVWLDQMQTHKTQVTPTYAMVFQVQTAHRLPCKLKLNKFIESKV